MSQGAESSAGWAENLGSIINRLSPALSSRPDAAEHLGEEEVRQLQLLGYLEQESDGP